MTNDAGIFMFSAQFQPGSYKARYILVSNIRKSLLFAGDVWHWSDECATLLQPLETTTGQVVCSTRNLNCVQRCSLQISVRMHACLMYFIAIFKTNSLNLFKKENSYKQ